MSCARSARSAAAEAFARGLDDLNGNPCEVIALRVSMGGDSRGLDQWSLGLDHAIDTNGATVTVAAGTMLLLALGLCGRLLCRRRPRA